MYLLLTISQLFITTCIYCAILSSAADKNYWLIDKNAHWLKIICPLPVCSLERLVRFPCWFMHSPLRQVVARFENRLWGHFSVSCWLRQLGKQFNLKLNHLWKTSDFSKFMGVSARTWGGGPSQWGHFADKVRLIFRDFVRTFFMAPSGLGLSFGTHLFVKVPRPEEAKGSI